MKSNNNYSLKYYCTKENNNVVWIDDNSTILVATSSPEIVPVPSTPVFNVTTTTTMVIPNVTASSREMVPVPSTALVMIRSFNVVTTTKTMVTLTFNSTAVVIVSSPFLGLTSMATPTFNSTALVILSSFEVQLDGTWWETTSMVVVVCMIIIIVLMFRSLPQRRQWYQHREQMQEQHQIRIRNLQIEAEEKQERRRNRQLRATIFLWGNCRFIMVDLETVESFPFDVSFDRVVHRTNLFIDLSSNRDDILQSTTRFETWNMVEQEWLQRIVILLIVGGADHPLVKINIIALRVYHQNKHSLQYWMEEMTGVNSASAAFVYLLNSLTIDWMFAIPTDDTIKYDITHGMLARMYCLFTGLYRLPRFLPTFERPRVPTLPECREMVVYRCRMIQPSTLSDCLFTGLYRLLRFLPSFERPR